MTEYHNSACPACGAGNGPGAPFCAGCGRALRRGGAFARPVDDDLHDDEPPRPAPDAVPRGAPGKGPARPADDDLDDVDDRPIRRTSRQDEDDDEPSIRDNPVLNLFFPVGVSIWALGSNYLGLLGLLAVVFGFIAAGITDVKILGLILPALGALMGLLALPLGALAFIRRPKKVTYGGTMSYIRAVLGILLGLLALIGGPAAIWVLSRA